MRGSDHQHNADVWFDDVGEVSDVAALRRAHFGNEVASVLRHFEHGKRQADFAVIGPLRHHGWAFVAQDRA